MKAGSTSWSQDTMMETTASAIGDHRRWLRHGAMRIGSTWGDDGSRSRALQGDGNLQMGVGQYGKNSRATHVSRDKSNKSCGLCQRVLVPEPGRETRRLKQGAGHTVKNRADLDQGMQAHRERSLTYG